MQVAKKQKVKAQTTKLDELIVHIFYLAAKQNIKEGDIHGPFLKIS